MKKYFFAAALTACLLTFSKYMTAQDPKCEGLKVDLANAEKRLETLQKHKFPMEEFFNLMEEPMTSTGPVNEEMALCQQRIKELEAKIAGGDNSGETAGYLQGYREQVELLKLRLSKDYNEKTFFSLQKYRALQKTMNNMSSQEWDMKRDTASIGAELRVRKCPGLGKQKIDDNIGDITTELGGTWAGKWKSADESQGHIKLGLNGSGSSTTGTLLFIIGQGKTMSHQVSGCSENGNKLSCTFTASLEDDEKFMDITGKVELTLTETGISSNWRETAIKPRWKPGKERAVQMRPFRNFSIVFIKE